MKFTSKQLIELAFKYDLPKTEIVFTLAQCARYVLPLTREQDREVCLKYIEAAERWSREPTEENSKAAHIAADAVYYAAYAAAYYAAYAAYAAYYAGAYAAYSAADAAYSAANAADAVYYAAYAVYYAAQASSDEEINRVILQNLPKLQRIVSLKAFW